MNYTAEQFFALTEEVESQGGISLDKMCAAREYELTGPVNKSPGKKLILAGCGNQGTIFEIPYERPAGTNAAILEKVEVCAVCDDMGGMPRFSKAMKRRASI